MKRKLFTTLLAILIITATPILVLARGGGGGSDSDSGSYSSSFDSDSGSYSGNSKGPSEPFIGSSFSYVFFGFIALFFFLLIVVKITAAIKLKKNIEYTDKKLEEAYNSGDPKWNKEKLEMAARDIFMRFQKAWGEINIPEMAEILETDFNKRISLELSVLNNEGRRNITEITNIKSIDILKIENIEGDNGDSFLALISAKADDKLIELENNNVLFRDRSSFTESWSFVFQDGKWKLKEIRQATENFWSLNPYIKEFAEKNKFYYNPDFGWLMLPNKGYLFSQSRFGNTDINNHVIGYYKDKIVEFYTMDINIGNNAKESYLIAQAILPIKHNDILIRRKSLFQFTPKDMRKHELESNDFIKEYNVYSHPDDNITTFELLNPSFMETITKLPFELNIEVVGNTLYLETKNSDVSYEKMLEILSLAFDEMKM